MREFLNPHYEGPECKCCKPKPETVDASIDALDERLELLEIELRVLREKADELKVKLDMFQNEWNVEEE